jgi:cytochrome c oxidase assembly factor CtaG
VSRRALVGAVAGLAALALPGAAAAHGDEVPTSELASAWSFPPAVVAPAAIVLVLFLQAWIRLRRRGRTDHAPTWRLVVFLAGLTLGVLALVSPLDAIAEEYLLSAHMLQHVLIGDAAPALILVALSGPLLFFLLPAPLLGPLARFRPLRDLLGVLARPAVALSVWCVVLAVWHVPALYGKALESRAVHDLQHVSLVIAGFLVWYQLVDPARRAALSRGGRLGLAVCLFAAGQVLSSVLLFSGRVLYSSYALQDERLLGLSPLTDQRLAGAVMMAEQAVSLGVLAAVLLLAAEHEARAETMAAAGPVGLSKNPRP